MLGPTLMRTFTHPTGQGTARSDLSRFRLLQEVCTAKRQKAPSVPIPELILSHAESRQGFAIVIYSSRKNLLAAVRIFLFQCRYLLAKDSFLANEVEVIWTE